MTGKLISLAHNGSNLMYENMEGITILINDTLFARLKDKQLYFIIEHKIQQKLVRSMS